MIGSEDMSSEPGTNIQQPFFIVRGHRHTNYKTSGATILAGAIRLLLLHADYSTRQTELLSGNSPGL
jgi:hypothetical protein